ncbi:hypothetical protein T484DRAFT_1905843 [Baffinella frigidus]|nr:hypothetical protein T484DRAFT_1905843 [Cryptophyta sp. CCMP2293]
MSRASALRHDFYAWRRLVRLRARARRSASRRERLVLRWLFRRWAGFIKAYRARFRIQALLVLRSRRRALARGLRLWALTALRTSTARDELLARVSLLMTRRVRLAAHRALSAWRVAAKHWGWGGGCGRVGGVHERVLVQGSLGAWRVVMKAGARRLRMRAGAVLILRATHLLRSCFGEWRDVADWARAERMEHADASSSPPQDTRNARQARFGTGAEARLGVEGQARLGMTAGAHLEMGVEVHLGTAAGVRLGTETEASRGMGAGARLGMGAERARLGTPAGGRLGMTG